MVWKTLSARNRVLVKPRQNGRCGKTTVLISDGQPDHGERLQLPRASRVALLAWNIQQTRHCMSLILGNLALPRWRNHAPFQCRREFQSSTVCRPVFQKHSTHPRYDRICDKAIVRVQSHPQRNDTKCNICKYQSQDGAR